MNWIQLASLSAYISGAAAILALIAIGLFFAGVKSFGPINDVLLGVMALCMIPIAVLNQSQAPGLIRTIVMLAGIAAMLTLTIHQLLLVTGKVHIHNYDRITEPTLAIMNGALGVIGLWLLAINYVSRNYAVFMGLPIVIGMLAGLGFVGMPIAYWRGGMKHPLTYVTGMLWQIGFPIWAIWLGSVLSAR
jgi:hypothetical protein